MGEVLARAIDDKILKRLDKNYPFIMIWYKYVAKCYRCKVSFFGRKSLEWINVETEWSYYPKKGKLMFKDEVLDYKDEMLYKHIDDICTIEKEV